MEEFYSEEAVLLARARQFAQVHAQIDNGVKAAVLLVRLGSEIYAVDLGLLRRVQLAKGLTPVPCTPPYVAGVLNVRGEVVTVLDLSEALGVQASGEVSETTRVLLVELREGQVGLLVDEVLGDRLIDVDQLDKALSGKEYTRGVAEASIVYLSLDQLLSGGRFDVLEEVT